MSEAIDTTVEKSKLHNSIIAIKDAISESVECCIETEAKDAEGAALLTALRNILQMADVEVDAALEVYCEVQGKIND